VQAFVTLGELEPSDVDVQLVHGRVDESDQLANTLTMTLSVAQAYEGGRMRYEAVWPGPLRTVRLHGPGAAAHRLLAGPAELGLVAVPPAGRARSATATPCAEASSARLPDCRAGGT